MTGIVSVKAEPFVLDLHGAFIRRTDLTGANLANANFSGADCTGAIFRGANFRGAILKGTILRGADLTDARNLTWEQVAEAVIDETTVLPDYLRDRASSISGVR
jgi:uncharacterized protein YjbI with pentapeptide repeats